MFSHLELVWLIIKRQFWLMEARNSFGIFNMLPQQLHNISFVSRRCWFKFRGPVINIPIVGDPIDKFIIGSRLLLIEIL